MIYNYYIRATGLNQEAGDGTSRWLKIRGMKNMGHYMEVEVKIQGRKRYVSVYDSARYLEFSRGIWPNAQPCSWHTVKKEYGYGYKV